MIYRQPGANVIDTVDQIRSALPGLQANIPPAISVHIVMDRTQTIRAAVRDVQTTLIITIVLVVLVIYLFLLNVRATLIPSAVIPIALLGAMAAMLPLKFSLDNLSLLALSIAVGFVVDDAIVMVEVIWKRLEAGETPFQAALNGAGEVSFTILTISISLVAGLHAPDVHGRRGRPLYARVRDHAERRRRCVHAADADAHPDALQPVPEAANAADPRHHPLDRPCLRPA